MTEKNKLSEIEQFKPLSSKDSLSARNYALVTYNQIMQENHLWKTGAEMAIMACVCSLCVLPQLLAQAETARHFCPGFPVGFGHR